MTEYPDHPPLPKEELSKGERTREEIMQAAIGLFSKQGYHGTSMRQIAEQAGIALGSIYNHFEGKEDIFQAVSLRYHPIHTILPGLEQSDGETVEEVVHQSANQMFDTLTQRQDFLNLMFIEVVEFKGKHLPGIFSEMFPQALKFSERLQTKRGKLRSEIPLPVMVSTLIGLMFSFFIIRRTLDAQSNLEPPKEMLQQVVDLYLHGILDENQNE